MNGVSVWDHEPTADEMLEKRIESGWQPIPTSTVDGDQILGHAACVVTGRGSATTSEI